MANMELITSVTVGAGGAASVTLPATGTIPQTYTDLKVIASVRGTAAVGIGSNSLLLKLNAITTGYTSKWLYGSGSSPGSTSGGPDSVGTMIFANDTASTFNSAEIYLPNYTSSNAKSYSVDSVTENNSATVNELDLLAKLNSTTSPITNITLTPETGNFAEGSTFYLYGISNVTSGSKATGGVVSSDGTYWYHTFPFSGTFTPTTALTADIMVIAGGGGASWSGAGAGGFRVLTSQSMTTTAYTCTIGAGGTGGVFSLTAPTSGVNSSISGSGFSTITSSGGGRSAYNAGTHQPASTGGSGGGGSYAATNGAQTGAAGNAGSYSPVEGYAGGNGTSSSPGFSGGGGGGASAVGANGTSVAGGAGGTGNNSYSSWASATGTGVNGYYAGGGAGGAQSPGVGGSGGLGGGGNGAATTAGGAGIANTGGGGGGTDSASGASVTGGTGGSGLVIIRYAI